MAPEPFQQILDEMRVRIQAELEAEVRAREAEAAVRLRQEAEADAEKRWAAKLDAVKAEWAARLESEIGAARAEAEKRLVGESMRLRNEADQALAGERQRAAEELEAERSRAAQQLRETLAAFEAERTDLEAQAASAPVRLEADSLLGAMHAIGSARSLPDALTAVLRGAAAFAPRAALFIVSDGRLEEWTAPGIASLAREPIEVDRGGLLRAALTTGERVAKDRNRTVPFAALPDNARAMAVPLVLGGQAVAVLYADDVAAAGAETKESWAESVELLARHAAACVAHLTAIRTLQAQGGGRGPAQAGAPDDEQSARRYAKLLVSEIKLYNEGAVRVGREKRDLLHRLRAEIERAQRLYEERVPSSLPGRSSFFQQELIHTLAGGDAALLGS